MRLKYLYPLAFGMLATVAATSSVQARVVCTALADADTGKILVQEGNCRDRVTPVEWRLLKRHSWLRDLWFRTGKPVYRFVTRKLLKWEDNEGQGPKP